MFSSILFLSTTTFVTLVTRSSATSSYQDFFIFKNLEFPGGIKTSAGVEFTLVLNKLSNYKLPTEIFDSLPRCDEQMKSLITTPATQTARYEHLRDINSTRKCDIFYCCSENSKDLHGNYSMFCSTDVFHDSLEAYDETCRNIFPGFSFDFDEIRTVCSRIGKLVLREIVLSELRLDQMLIDFPLLETLVLHKIVTDAIIPGKMSPSFVKTLQITESGLTSLQENVFECCLETLQHLDLSRNELKVLENFTFVNLYELKSLNLSSNKLETLELHSFFSSSHNETTTEDFDCQQTSCNFQITETNPEDDAFKSLREPAIQSILINNTSHVVVVTDRKEMKEYRSQMRSWINLESLDLSANLISTVNPLFFSQALRNLRHLFLSRNRIGSLSRILLRDLEFLETLDLSDNSIVWIDGGFFVHRYLKNIDLSRNSIKKILSMTFLYLPAIQVINLNKNDIVFIHRTAFYRLCKESGPGRRISISLRENRLRTNNAWRITNIVLDSLLGNFTENCRLDLDLSRNEISHLFGGGVQAIKPYDVRYLTRIWLKRMILHMSGNSLSCDCATLSDANLLMDLLSGKYSPEDSAYGLKYEFSKESVETLLSLKCMEPDRYFGLTLAQFHESGRLKCDINELLKNTVNNFYCPDGCSCEKLDVPSRFSSYGISTIVFQVNCSHRHFVNFPFPGQLSLMYSDSSSVKGKQFLIFNEDHQSLEYEEDQEYGNAVEIDMSYNLFTKIDFKRLAKLYPNLNSLSLHQNNMSAISESIFLLKSLRNLTLSGNPLRCSCVPSTIMPLKELALNGIIADLSAILCVDGPPLEDFLRHDLKFCLNHFKTLRLVGEGLSYVENASEISFPAAVICSLVIAFLLTIVIYLKIKKFRKKNKSTDWSLKCLPSEQRTTETTEEKLFCEIGEPRLTKDVFVMYCEEEESWVTGCLLEIFWSTFPRYRVCLQQHIQDDSNSRRTNSSVTITTPSPMTTDDSSEFSKLIPSTGLPAMKSSLACLQINDCLIQIRQSQLTVVILSESFMKTFWTSEFFRQGLLRQLESQRHRFIFIFRQRWLDLEERDRSLYAAVCDYDCLIAEDERLAQKLGELLPQPLPSSVSWPARVASESPRRDGTLKVSTAPIHDFKIGHGVLDSRGHYVKVTELSNEKY